jgi:cell shape-determining protein MreC
MLVKDVVFGMVGFIVAVAVYDQCDSALAKITRNKRLENENRVLKQRILEKKMGLK